MVSWTTDLQFLVTVIPGVRLLVLPQFCAFAATILKIDCLHNYNYVEFSKKSYDFFASWDHLIIIMKGPKHI